MPQRRETPVELRRVIGAVALGRNRIAVEEGERVVVAHLLPRVDERQAARHDEREEGHDLACGAQPGELRPAPRILVVVRSEGQPHGRRGVAVTIGVDVIAQRRQTHLALRDVAHQVVHLPRIAGIERRGVEQVALLGLGQHEQVGLQHAQPPHRLVPELDGDQHRHVAAEAVDGMLREPEGHRIGLRTPHGAVAVVEFRRIGPVPRHGRSPRGIALVPVGRALGDPTGVARRVVGHPVEQHLHAETVGLGDEGVEIGHRAQLGIDRAVVADRIVGSERTLALQLADGIDGHEPHGVDAHVAQKRQFFHRGAEGSLRRELPHVHFIKHGVVTPCRMQCMLHNQSYCFSVDRPTVRARPSRPQPAKARTALRVAKPPSVRSAATRAIKVFRYAPRVGAIGRSTPACERPQSAISIRSTSRTERSSTTISTGAPSLVTSTRSGSARTVRTRPR